MELKGLIQIIFSNEWQLWLYYYWKSIIIVIIIVIITIIIIIPCMWSQFWFVK